MSAPPQVSALSIFTIGVQGPPGVALTFAGLTILTVVNTGSSLLSGGFYPIDTTGGVVTLNAPAAVDGAIFGVSDVFGNSPVAPIVINAVGVGVTLGDPSNPGAFAASVHIASPNAPTVWWAFVQTASKWIPVWW